MWRRTTETALLGLLLCSRLHNKTAKQIRQEYDKETAKNFIKNSLCLTYAGVKYFECEYSPFNVEDFEPLSNISDINFYDTDTDFN